MTASRSRTGGSGTDARPGPSGVAVTIVVHEHKRLGRGIELAALAEQLRAAEIGLEFLTGELQGSHDPSGAAVTDEAMLAVVLHLRGQELSLRDIASRLVIAAGKKKGQHPSPSTVMRMLHEHDQKAAAAG
jgi:hypothetical protein